jgi:hypothetical protein
LATHIHHHLDHFHFLATSYVEFLPMNIGPLFSSPTNIILSVVNRSCIFSLLVQLATDCPLELVSSCSRNSGQTFILWWHTLCIFTCYFLMPNIPF